MRVEINGNEREFRCECTKCESVLFYRNEDIRITDAGNKYIPCPVCGVKIPVKKKFDNIYAAPIGAISTEELLAKIDEINTMA